MEKEKEKEGEEATVESGVEGFENGDPDVGRGILIGQNVLQALQERLRNG